MSKNFIQLSNGEVCAWIEQGAVHIKAINSYGDPIELTRKEVRDLAEALLQFCMVIDEE